MPSSVPVDFDAAQHSYVYQGTPLISVTQAIGAAGLIETEWFTEQSRQRGRLVHLITEYYDQNELDFSSVAPVLRPYLDAYIRFRKDTGFIPDKVEACFGIPEMGYAGTLDRVGYFNATDKKRRAVIDFKTGQMCPWVRLQLAGYANSQPEGGSLERHGLQLKSDGTYRITVFPVREYRQDLNDFLCCVRTAQLQRELRG